MLEEYPKFPNTNNRRASETTRSVYMRPYIRQQAFAKMKSKRTSTGKGEKPVEVRFEHCELAQLQLSCAILSDFFNYSFPMERSVSIARRSCTTGLLYPPTPSRDRLWIFRTRGRHRLADFLPPGSFRS